MPLTRKLTIAKSNDGGLTIYVYEGAATGPTASKPSEILGLAYTLYRDRDRLHISRGLDMHGSKATMIANVNGFEGVTAKINAGAQTFASTRRVSSMPWKFTDESQQKYKWHVTSQGRYWDLRAKGGSNAATFTNNGPFEETLGVLEFTRGATESFTQLALLTWNLTRQSLNDQRQKKGANHSPNTTNAWFIDGFYGSDGSGHSNSQHGWYTSGGGHHHGDHGGDCGGGHSGGGGDCGGGGGGGGDSGGGGS
ncbi:hypothetical protein EC988_003876 [Linderina pennispora]|nr:hypothetical protein EC988_003876 [Linderina pennispora]